jgi:hypothetical protein
VEELTRLTLEFGMDTFIYWPSEDHVRQIEVFAGEVVPAAREAVEAERSRA